MDSSTKAGPVRRLSAPGAWNKAPLLEKWPIGLHFLTDSSWFMFLAEITSIPKCLLPFKGIERTKSQIETLCQSVSSGAWFLNLLFLSQPLRLVQACRLADEQRSFMTRIVKLYFRLRGYDNKFSSHLLVLLCRLSLSEMDDWVTCYLLCTLKELKEAKSKERRWLWSV